jgi:DNA polymerase III epsilon subunit-like protein
MQLRSRTLLKYVDPVATTKTVSVSVQTEVESTYESGMVDPILVAISAQEDVTFHIRDSCRRHDSRLVLVFDTETTGLVPKTNHQTHIYPALEEYPHMLQLCFVLYNLDTETIEQEYNEYIRVDDDIPILPIITQITGITRDMCTAPRGVDVADAMTAFYHAYMQCGVVVAHNIRFDKEVIKAEMERHHHAMVERGCASPVALFHHVYMRIHQMTTVCTMLDGLRIPDPETGARVPKWPKLSELHRRLFGTVPDGLHDARVDVMACLRCYQEMIRLRSSSSSEDTVSIF